MGDEQDHEVADILRHISASLTNLETAVLPEAYYYSSLPLCVIDAVYSIGVNYESTRRTVSTWCEAQTPPWRRVCNELAERGDHTMAEFVELLTQTSAEELANSVFKNKQRTSTKNGILKAEAISLFAKVLVDSKIENFSDTEEKRRLPQQGKA
jgi:hypothetical protein